MKAALTQISGNNYADFKFWMTKTPGLGSLSTIKIIMIIS